MHLVLKPHFQKKVQNLFIIFSRLMNLLKLFNSFNKIYKFFKISMLDVLQTKNGTDVIRESAVAQW